MKIEELGPDELMELYVASIVGPSALALELERLGLSDQEDSLLDAQRLRPRLLEAVEQGRRQQGGGGGIARLSVHYQLDSFPPRKTA